MRFIRKLNEDNSLSSELVDLIIEEAYLVERGKKKCFESFDKQRLQMEEHMMRQQEEFLKLQKDGKIPNPFAGIQDDEAMKKLMEMGLAMPGMPPGMMPGMMPPGMMPPGMMPPGMMPPGMMPPGMPPGMIPPELLAMFDPSQAQGANPNNQKKNNPHIPK